MCDKYLQVFSDFKVVRSFFDSSDAAAPFVPDPFKIPGTNEPFSPRAFSVPLQNPFNPFTVADATIPDFFSDGRGLPVNTGVGFRAINDTGRDTKSSLTAIICSMLACAAKWENLAIISRPGTGKWVSVMLETKERTCPSAK